MAVKTITITEEAYSLLRRAKAAEESFSEVIIRITKGRKVDLKKYAGVLSEKRAEELKSFVKKTREKASLDAKERMKDVRSR